MKSSGKSIKQNPTAKLLGITFDYNLAWNKQIIMTKLTYGVLRVLSPSSALRRLQHAIVSLNHLFYHKLIIAMLLRPNA